MNGKINADVSYLSCQINGMKYILQTVSDTNVKDAISSEKQNTVDVKETEAEELAKEEESIPLASLDGEVWYALQNGVFQELDISQFVDQENCHDKTLLVPKDMDNCGNEYINNENIIFENMNEHSEEQYEVVTNNTEKDFFIGKNSINANDFVEVVTAFKCKICTYTTQDKMQLLDHFQNTHMNPTLDLEPTEESKNISESKLVYMCGECSNCYSSIESCKEHMIEDHQLTDTVADKSEKENLTNDLTGSTLVTEHVEECDESTEVKHEVKMPKTLDSEYILNKKMIELTERTVKCSYRGCPYKFASEEIMQQHVLCHTESQTVTTFKCNVCRDIKFTKWRQCSLHLWKKHQIDVGLFTCKICKAYKSATMVKLLTHMRVHSETHRKTLEVTRWYTSKKCDICGKTYANSKCLKNHIQAVHSKLRPYVCSVCGHASARKAMLQMHFRQHTGDKPFSCEICEYKTGDHNTLRRHIMQHTGFRPYKCQHCSYTAIQSSSYKNHLKSRHPMLSGLFTCNLCPFKTVNNESYIQHLRDHEKGLIKHNAQKKDNENVEVFPGNIAAAQLIYSCLGAFSKVGDTLEANLMSSSTSADGTSQTITIQIPSKHLEGSLPTKETLYKNNSTIEQEDDETMHCFLKIPREEEESIDTGGITIPAEPEEASMTTIDVDT
ncbi:zinc finger protein 266 isoform X2 [Harpegnathos saltator]|uniref:zinc finger protein 266 isoform X2 n=1 Tax=Harpegnathos saltator TaxID=610380 RepID=UPI00058DEE46|nr:zinc finger protein 266 isoform X2 [Harpegnathos saltator]